MVVVVVVVAAEVAAALEAAAPLLALAVAADEPGMVAALTPAKMATATEAPPAVPSVSRRRRRSARLRESGVKARLLFSMSPTMAAGPALNL